MSAPGNATGEIKPRQRAVALMGHLIAALSLLAIGYPLAPATIRAMLLVWILMAVAMTERETAHYLSTKISSVATRTVPAIRSGGQCCSREMDHDCA